MKQVGGKGVSKKKKLNNKGGGRVGESDSALPDSLDPPEKQLRVTIGGVMQGVGGVPIVTEYEVPPSASHLCERATLDSREHCYEMGPWDVGGSSCAFPPASPSPADGCSSRPSV